MAEFEKDSLEEIEDELVVIVTDEDGNEFYYREEMIIPVDGKKFAILIPLHNDDECEDESCDCCDGDDTDVFVARIDIDESGEEVYVDPTDEEFDAVLNAYEEAVEDDEA
ncbi:DUF1292 domain-containing protein [Azotosporobacter soli]|uniref:DUF1292 domain-containing protein n=1 Tax=Azotosporobacter soli TaxID=3055040 RepID=UPI0031FEC41A